MVTLGISGLIAAYIIIAILLLSVNLYSSWSWKIKASLTILVACFYLVSYYSFPPLLGWPSDDVPPKRFRLLAEYVQEPNKHLGTDGAIYIWATNMDGDPSVIEPRAYKLPYSNAMHQKLIDVGKKLRKKMPQLGETEDPDAPNATPKDKRGGQVSVNIQFYDLPDPLFPEK